MRTPAVSVLMAAYNREPYIGSAIESVLSQRFDDFELVVVDDCSTDGTRAIAERYAQRDPRIRVVANERNLGQFPNRNRAAFHARAPLIKYHDSDDILYPHGLEVMVAAMRAVPDAAAGLSQGRAWPGGPCPMRLTPPLAFAREFLGSGVFQCGPGGTIIRKAAFDSVRGFRDAGVHGDYLLWMDLARTFPIVLLPADLSWYREHPEQEFRRADAAYDYARLNAEVWRALTDPTCPLEGEARERARRNQAANVAKQTWRDLKRGHPSIALYRLRHAGLSMGEWLRYLRVPRRDAAAGTPLAIDDQVSLPDWTGALDRPVHQ